MSKSKLSIIDADFLMYVCCHNKVDSETTKTLEDVIKHAEEIISNILSYTKAEHYIGCLTVGKCFRYDFYPEYKANRSKLDKPLYFEELRNYLIEEKKFIFHVGLEADDMISILNTSYKDTYDITIVSTDKDLQQIPGNHFNPVKFERTDVDKRNANIKLWGQVITGDSVDNIKGVPKKGEKYVEKVFQHCFDHLMPIPGAVLDTYMDYYGQYQGILEFTKNYRLVKLLEEPEYGFDPSNVDLVKLDEQRDKFYDGRMEGW
jgi:5'-3' exonuclease